MPELLVLLWKGYLFFILKSLAAAVDSHWEPKRMLLSSKISWSYKVTKVIWDTADQLDRVKMDII